MKAEIEQLINENLAIMQDKADKIAIAQAILNQICDPVADSLLRISTTQNKRITLISYNDFDIDFESQLTDLTEFTNEDNCRKSNETYFAIISKNLYELAVKKTLDNIFQIEGEIIGQFYYTNNSNESNEMIHYLVYHFTDCLFSIKFYEHYEI